MIGLGFLLASTVATSTDLPKLGAPIGDVARWFNDSDWTSSRAGGAVRFKVVFNQDGVPDTCLIQVTTGNKEVEKLACAVASKRFRFKASLDTEGSPVDRIFVRAVAMEDRIPDSIRPPALFSLTVNGYKHVSRLSVIVDVKADGSIAGCSGAQKKKALRALGEAVCQSVVSLWEPLPEVGSDGNPIRYVRDVPVDIKHAP